MSKRIAEALVECGYAESIGHDPNHRNVPTAVTKDYKRVTIIDPFADTLEGRRQADALEDWLIYKGYYNEFDFSKLAGWPRNFHQWRLDRIKWCFEELSDDD